jgi:hypothetical protein
VLQRIVIGILLLALAGTSLAQTVFREDFNPGTASTCDLAAGLGNLAFPSGWLLRNVDNRTPSPNVAYVNDAWEVREDFAGDLTNCVAFSNSFYEPNGAADDWMWSPPIVLPNGANLRWRAKSYDAQFRDTYEVRIMNAAGGPPTGGNGQIGNQISNSTLLATVTNEETQWTVRQISLAGFAGQTVHIGFRNISNNRFLLVIDDVDVSAEGPDLLPIGPAGPGPWARIPANLATNYRLGVGVANIGSQAANSVNVTATQLINGVAVGFPLSSNTVATIGPFTSVPTAWIVQPAAPRASGTYVTRYTVATVPGELNPNDNTIDSLPLEVGGTELSRYLGPVAGPFGIGAGNGGELSTMIELPAALTVVGVRLRMEARPPVVPPAEDRWTGRPIIARLRAADATGVPLEPVLHQTLPGVGSRSGVTYELAFSAPVTLPAGRYALSAVEPVDSEAMSVARHAQIFEAGANRVTWPTSPTPGWTTIESFGTQLAGTPQIGLLTRFGLLTDGFESAAPPPPAKAQAPQWDASRRADPQSTRLVDAVNN